MAVAAVTPDGKRAVSAANDFTLKVWDLRAGASCVPLPATPVRSKGGGNAGREARSLGV